MASANHINYWNYLENVTANRNREQEMSTHNRIVEGLDTRKTMAQVSLNASQELLNAASTLKVKADTAVSYANVAKIAADTIVSKVQADKLNQDIIASQYNVVFQNRSLNLRAQEIAIGVEQFAKKYLLDERDVATREGNLELGIAKLEQELGIHRDKMNQQELDRMQKFYLDTSETVRSTQRDIVSIVNGILKIISVGK